MGLYKMPQFVRIAVEGLCPNPTRTDIRAGRHEIVIDEPPIRHGKDEGMLPLQALMASFAACTHAVVNVIAQELKLDFRDSAVDVDAKFDTRGYTGDADVSPPFPEVDLTVKFSSTASVDDLEELKAQLRWRCPVSAQLRAAGTKINENWIQEDG